MSFRYAFLSALRSTIFRLQTRFRSVNNVADAKLENTSLSTDVVQGSLNEILYFQRYEKSNEMIWIQTDIWMWDEKLG